MTRPTLPTPDLALSPEGLTITTPTPHGPAVAHLDPWQVLALGRRAAELWAGRNAGDEQAEDQGRRGVL